MILSHAGTVYATQDTYPKSKAKVRSLSCLLLLPFAASSSPSMVGVISDSEFQLPLLCLAGRHGCLQLASPIRYCSKLAPPPQLKTQ